MNNLIIDATLDKIFLAIIINKNIYTSTHENSKRNFEKLVILIEEFLFNNQFSISKVNKIYVNRGPGSFAGIRNSLAIVKAIHLTRNIDYFCFSFNDFTKLDTIKYEDIPSLCNKFRIKKNLINPLYLS